MRRFASPLLIGLTLSIPAFGQTATTLPATTQPSAMQAPADLDLGKLFRSRIAGIEFNPPAGGSMIRDLNSGEVVRFVYGQSGWDVRVKAIPLHNPLPLSAAGDGGVLELMVSQLLSTNPSTQILRRDVIQLNGRSVGLIEAKYNMGPDSVFAQQAIFRDNDEHYLLVQMSGRCDPKPVANVPDPLETEARGMFAKVLPTVKILDRQELANEQRHRSFQTRELWVLFDRKKITETILPLRLMRIIRDGKDIGFIQVNERLATHNGNDGVEIIIRSRVQTDPTPPDAVKAAAADAAAPVNAPAAGTVVPGSVLPSAADPASTKPSGPSNLFTSSTFFVTFDRDHEDWTSITQVDDQVATQLVESANTDMTLRRALQRGAPATQPGQTTEGSTHRFNQNPQIVTLQNYVLNIEYSHGRRQDKPRDIQLPPDYLPQAIAQLLPRLLPNDPAKYMFSFYVSGEQKLMRRYVDVDEAREVVLDGKTVRAVPISDRIGVDGIPTIHYVSRSGEWLGSVNEDQKLVVLPTDEGTLSDIWSKQPLGFKVADLPPEQVETPVGPKKNHPLNDSTPR